MLCSRRLFPAVLTYCMYGIKLTRRTFHLTLQAYMSHFNQRRLLCSISELFQHNPAFVNMRIFIMFKITLVFLRISKCVVTVQVNLSFILFSYCDVFPSKAQYIITLNLRRVFDRILKLGVKTKRDEMGSWTTKAVTKFCN